MANRDKISDLMKRAAPYLTRISDDVNTDTTDKEIDALIMALETHKASADHDGIAHIWTALNRFLQTIEVKSVIPSNSDSSDIGSSTRLFRKGFFSELSTLVFKKENVLVMDGTLVLTKQSGKFEADVSDSATAIDFGQAMTPGDFLLLRAENKMEFMRVGSLVSGTTYNVTRNIDGSGADAWNAGSVYFVRGHEGDGWLELTATDDQRISVFLQGDDWNKSTEVARIGSLDNWQATGIGGYGLAIGNALINESMTFTDQNNKLVLSGEVNATSGTLNELDVVGTLEISADGKVQIGNVASSNIKIEDDKIIGELGGSGNVQFLLGNLNGYYGLTTDAWGFGVGAHDLSGSYIKFQGDNLIIRGNLESGNGNVLINQSGITVLPDPNAGGDYTSIIKYGEDSETITSVLESYSGANDTATRIKNIATSKTSTITHTAISNIWSKVRLVASKLLSPTKNAIIELFANGVESKITMTADTLDLQAASLMLNNGKVKNIAEPLGIPQANALGKIDQSWLPVEQPTAGSYTIPANGMFLWAAPTAPTNFGFVGDLDNNFMMGHGSTSISTARGSLTHKHTNPSTKTKAGHNNHAMNIGASSQGAGSAVWHWADASWIVGTHNHPTGTGSNQSLAGSHAHTFPDTNTADSRPPYYTLRWVKPTIDRPAPIGAIVMEATGADLGPDWAICNGANGTPDLTDKFIYGGTAGSTGGSKTHSHTTSGNSSTDPDHTHTIDVRSSTVDYTGSSTVGGSLGASDRHYHDKYGATSKPGGAHSHTIGTSSIEETLPPYIVIRYWQRISTSNDRAFPAGTLMPMYSGSAPVGYKTYTEGYGYMFKGVASAELVGTKVGTAYGTAHTHLAGTVSTVAAHSHATSDTITYNNAGGSSRSSGTGTGTTRIESHTHTFTFALGAADSHTHTLESQDTGATNALPPHRYVLIAIKEEAAPTGSLTVTGDLAVGGKAAITGDLKDGDGNTYVIGTKTWSTYTPTTTGWSSITSSAYRYATIGKTCLLTILITSGTSNATTASVSLPIKAATIGSGLGVSGTWGAAMDNSVGLTAAGRWVITSGGTTVHFYKDMWVGTWTASGAKRIYAQIIYETE